MRYFAGLSLFAALVLAAPATHAFTMQNQDGTSNPAAKSNAGTQKNYGGTLTTPGVGYTTGDSTAVTPSASGSDTSTPKPGFSFHTGPASNSSSLRAPAWSTDPLYRERGGQ